MTLNILVFNDQYAQDFTELKDNLHPLKERHSKFSYVPIFATVTILACLKTLDPDQETILLLKHV